jgi:ligand-binding sensor domain-containing protein/DNA-binding CsgD family transcriptional regulator
MKKLTALIILTGFCLVSASQNSIGLPDIVNYTKDLSRKGAQNRQVRQDKKGLLYFANSDGVLSFDGIHWRTYSLPNKSIVRSLEFGPEGHLYVGGQDEFGILAPGPNGALVYKSLKHIIPKEDRSFSDVWQIIEYRGSMFFQTSDKIYQVSGNHATVYKSSHWRFLGKFGDVLLAQDLDNGLLYFENSIWKPYLKESDLPRDHFTTSVTRINKDSALLTTVKHGIFLISDNICRKLQSPFIENLARKNISASLMVNDDHIAITTNLDGCHIIDKKGNLVRSFTKKEGLQNNNILDIFMDREKNLWLGLENGIDFIAYNNAIKHIYPDYLNEGSGYSARIHENHLYIGTSSGLYSVPLQKEKDLSLLKGKFTPVENTSGQVWNLSEVNGKLLLGHHEGAFVIKQQTAIPIDRSSGFWNFQPLSNVMPASVMVTGTYQGVNFYQYSDQRFTSKNLFAHFESSRFIVPDNENVWVGHPYKGIYKVRLENNQPLIKKYTQREGILSENGNYIFRINNQIILTTENGIFEYHATEDVFKPSEYYNKIFGRHKVRYLKEDAQGNLWFVFDKVLGVAELKTPGVPLIYFPELNNRFVAGFEFIYPIDQNNILIGGEKGFFHLNYEEYKKLKYPLQVVISSIKLFGETDSLLFGGYSGSVNDEKMLPVDATKINFGFNSFYFEFAAPVYGQQTNIEYSYILEGSDDKWSDFSKRSEKEYTKLEPGNYTFRVKARNNLGKESEEVIYKFTILPPWYQSDPAISLYILLFAFGIFILMRYQKKKFALQQLKHQKEQEQLQYLHQLEIEKAEQELVRLKNEKLEAEIEYKNKELASTAMHLVQKGELLGKVKEQMMQLKKVQGFDAGSDNFKKIMRTISEEDKMDNQWEEQFAVHFDTIHRDFLFNLKTKFPALSSNELKLCAYLRLNLTTKEIAQLMNISVRGVEISRYRLRKKLAVPTEINLYNFLIESTSQEINQI